MKTEYSSYTLVAVVIILIFSGWGFAVYSFLHSKSLEQRLRSELLTEIQDHLSVQSSIHREVEKSKEEQFFLTQLQLNTQLEELKQEFRQYIADQLRASSDQHEQTLGLLDEFSREMQAHKIRMEQDRLLGEESFKAKEQELTGMMDAMVKDLAALKNRVRAAQNGLEKAGSDFDSFLARYEEQRLSLRNELESQQKTFRKRIRELENSVAALREEISAASPQSGTPPN